MPNVPVTLPSRLIPKAESDPQKYWTSSIWRRWELTVNWKTKIYLTDEERNYFVEQLKLGKKIILIGEMLLTKQFDCLIPLSPKYKPMEPGEVKYY